MPCSIWWSHSFSSFAALWNIFDKAIADTSKVIELNPYYMPAYSSRAVYVSTKYSLFHINEKENKQNYLLILAEFDKVIQLKSKEPYSYFDKAELLAQSGKKTFAYGRFTPK